MRNCLALAVILVAACNPPATSSREADAGATADDDAMIDAGRSADASDAAIDASPDAGPDLTAPSLVEASPSSGEAWLHAPIRLVFDEDITAASAAMSSVSATLSGEAITATLAYEAPRTLVVTLDPAARGVGVLGVHVSPNVADTAGNAQTAPIDLALTIPAWSAVPIDRGTAVSTPSIVTRGNGTLVAAWLVTTTLGRRAMVAELAGSTWTNLGNGLAVADPNSVAITLDDNGVPLVALADIGTVHVARWDGTSWNTLASPGTGDRVAIVTPTGGHPIVAFGTANTVSVRELVNDTWLPLGSNLTAPAAITSEVTLASAAAGTAVVGWIGADLALRTYRLDADWTALSPLAVSTGSRMSLAARGSSVAVAFDRWAGSSGVLVALASGGATTFSTLGKPLDIDLAGDARAPAIRLDASGAPVVAWTELVETAERGALARWSGSVWTIIGGTSWLASTSIAPTAPTLTLGPGDAPVVATAVGSAVRIARFNGPRTAALGITVRAPLDGCSFDPAAPPALLSQTGCFDLSVAKSPRAHAGLVPYDVVAELWSDGAKKRRWIGLPNGQSMTLGSNGAWAAPIGTIMVKEFALETTPGNPGTRRPVETRILVNDATNGWQGFSYQWNVAGTDASLLPDTAQNIGWTMDNGSTHTHVYPSRAHCRSCHYVSSGPLLGLRPEQLARWFDYDGTIADQPATLVALGVVTPSTPPAFTAPHDPSATVEKRMRGYMAANCSHCHNPQYLNIKDLRYATPLASTKLCDVIVPGSPSQSIVYQKVTSRPGMPPLGTAAVDPLAEELLGAWITGMTSCP